MKKLFLAVLISVFAITIANTAITGQTIKNLREKKGFTQAELAYKLGVTDKAISKWERNVNFPDITLLPVLADLFNCSIDELFQLNDRD